jgi:hypothetical protein
LASELAGLHPLVCRGLQSGGPYVPAQGQGGWFAGTNQHNRCQRVLLSSLRTAWQYFDKPAIPPWFTSRNFPRTRRRPPDFASSSETPGGYVGQAVLETTERALKDQGDVNSAFRFTTYAL